MLKKSPIVDGADQKISYSDRLQRYLFVHITSVTVPNGHHSFWKASILETILFMFLQIKRKKYI